MGLTDRCDAFTCVRVCALLYDEQSEDRVEHFRIEDGAGFLTCIQRARIRFKLGLDILLCGLG